MSKGMTKFGGKRQLESDGFRICETYHGTIGSIPRWFIVVPPGRTEQAVVLHQGPSCWHVFYKFRGTSSGTSPLRALEGGLGDAISTDSQMQTYRKLVKSAPKYMVRSYEGLNAAQEQVAYL